ncbi:MAG: hypothetical protein M0029_11600 [Actinomycetota bacterium]|nr:hypothetical protein [Actinomycetota bacterium]
MPAFGAGAGRHQDAEDFYLQQGPSVPNQQVFVQLGTDLAVCGRLDRIRRRIGTVPRRTHQSASAADRHDATVVAPTTRARRTAATRAPWFVRA